MKKTIALILTLGMILSMTACGGKSTTEEPATTEAITEESTSIEVASETTVPDDSVAEETNEAETTEETNEADSSQEIQAIVDAEARLLSFYHTADSTYIAAVYPQNITDGRLPLPRRKVRIGKQKISSSMSSAVPVKKIFPSPLTIWFLRKNTPILAFTGWGIAT